MCISYVDIALTHEISNLSEKLSKHLLMYYKLHVLFLFLIYNSMKILQIPLSFKNHIYSSKKFFVCYILNACLTGYDNV